MSKEIKTAADLKQDSHNYRKHSETNKARIRKSIDEAGLGRSVVVDADGVLVAGNGVQSVIDKDTPVRVVETDGTELVVVKRTDLHTDDPRRKTLALADNATADDVEWDFDAISEDWTEDEAGDWGVEWPADEEEIEQKEAQEDDFDPDSVTETVCKKGDIWKLGNHRLMCGDSTDVASVALLMDGEKADLLFTDPPYGYEYQSNMRTKSEKFDVLKNDDKILDFFPLLPSFVDGWIFVCTTWKVLDMWTAIFKKQYDFTNLIVWDKGGGYIGDLRKTFGTDYEIIMCSNNGKELTGKRLGSVWSIGKDNAEKYDHPTQKPVALSGTAIDCTTNEGGIVLDLFGGSGTTLIAAEQLNRKCYMMELDPHYCDVIIARWEKLTGNKAEKLK